MPEGRCTRLQGPGGGLEVKAGQLLAELDEEAAASRLQIARQALVTAEAVGCPSSTGCCPAARCAAQAVDLLSWRGLALYGMTLDIVKIAHEFGHALVARHHGCRVPSMGAAFMVLWPVAYTDTSEVWRLSDARARMQAALASVRTELSIAAWAMLVWVLLPDGPLRTAAFILGTLTAHRPWPVVAPVAGPCGV